MIAKPEPTTCVESEPYALQVRDDSMAPEFWAGCIILVDPSGHVTDGAYVLAEVDNQYVFRLLHKNTQGTFLKSLNPSFPTTRLRSTESIKGVIVQRSGTRRRHHKHYV